MLPIQLSMTAFGPFAKTQVIDFSALGVHPLFLINGPTGAGKTSILDAICYALYGETTGEERLGKDMRCHHSPQEVLTEITFSFSLHEKRFEIRRIPEQKRPKQRGGKGLTVETGSAWLWRQIDSGDKEIMATGAKKTNTAVVELTGLSASQFRQVMVLPQGKFRKLLLAKSEEREKIFEKLFSTGVYSLIQEKLKAKASVLIEENRFLAEHKSRILLSVDLEDEHELDEKLGSASKEKELLFAQKEMAASEHRKALEAFTLGVQHEKLFLDWISAKARRSTVHEKENEHLANKNILIGARASAQLHPAFLDVQKCENSFVGLKKEHSTAEIAETQAEKVAMVAEQDKIEAESFIDEIDRLKRKHGEVEGLKTRVRRWGDVAEQVAEKRVLAAKARKLKSDLEANHVVITKRQDQLEHDREFFRVQSEGLESLNNKREHYKKVQNWLAENLQKEQKAVDFQDHKEILEEQFTNIERECSTQEKSLKEMENAWTGGQAGILAQTLKKGIACPVCGSLEHPVKAEINEGVPTEKVIESCKAQIDHTKHSIDDIQKKIQDHESRISALRLQIKSRREDMGELRDLEQTELQNELNHLGGLIQIKIKAQESIPSQAEIDKNKGDLQECQTEIAKAEKEERAIQLSLSGREAEHKLLAADIDEKYRDPCFLDKELVLLESDQHRLSKKMDLARRTFLEAIKHRESSRARRKTLFSAMEKAHHELKGVVGKWDNALGKSQFEDVDAFLEAYSRVEEIDSLENTIRAHQDEKVAADASCSELENSLRGVTRPDLTKLEAERKFTEKNMASFEGEYQIKKNLCIELSKARKSLQKLNKEFAVNENSYKTVGSLSDIANGKNVHRLSLQSFVLSVLLDDVLLEAGERLATMSKGRYRLHRKKEVIDRRAKSGLELEVSDSYTGLCRPVSTLSGGESFLAALSMALGLSNVVQAYSGGIRLDMLFIDEGFGSLDVESLDLAINSLVALQKTGRMIGLISHVPELKERIEKRIDLTTSQSGSTAHLVSV